MKLKYCLRQESLLFKNKPFAFYKEKILRLFAPVYYMKTLPHWLLGHNVSTLLATSHETIPHNCSSQQHATKNQYRNRYQNTFAETTSSLCLNNSQRFMTYSQMSVWTEFPWLSVFEKVQDCRKDGRTSWIAIKPGSISKKASGFDRYLFQLFLWFWPLFILIIPKWL